MSDQSGFDGRDPASSDVTLRRAWAVTSPASFSLPAWLGEDTARIGRDDITGLVDRRGFGAALAAAEALVAQHVWPGYAVLALDLDRFKAVNDRLGHAAGDLLLRAAASRIARGLRGGDLAARIGGDEFAVLLASPVTDEVAGTVASRLIDMLGHPFMLGGRTALIGASAGIARSDSEERHGAALLRRADLALVQAKAEGRARWRAFDAGMQSRVAAHRTLEHDLRDAVARGGLRLLYQPWQDQSGVIRGQEALLGWDRPGHGTLRPAEFLPLAEEVGLAGPIGAWMLSTACRDAAGWPDTSLTLTVRVTWAQLTGSTLVADVTRALSASGLPPERLEIGVAEAALMQEIDPKLPQLQALRERRIRIALCDFGARHASLTLLRAFPFSRLAIDNGFAQSLTGDPAGKALLHALIPMGGVLAIG